MHYEEHAEYIIRKYPHCFHLDSKVITHFERLDKSPLPHLITDGIGLTSTRETLREERQMFGSYQIYVHAKTKSDLDQLMAMV